MPKRASLNYVETEGGPFILLPLEHKKSWNGAEGDYARATAFGSGVGVVDVGSGGKALILGTVDVTAFHPLDDGGVFIQRVYGDDDAAVVAVAEKALKGKDWKSANLKFDAGKGKLALFDSALSYEDCDADARLKVTLAPGTYEISRAIAKGKDIELGLVRLRRV